MDAAVQERVSKVAANIRRQVDERSWIDIGLGAEKLLGESRVLFTVAIETLRTDGYQTFSVRVKNSGKYVTVKVLGRPESTARECYENRQDIVALLPV
jgi:hypothetical protein